MLVSTTGAVLRRLKYGFGGREKLLSFGEYPDVALKRAREKRKAARELLDRGIDPSAERRMAKLAQVETLKAIAEEWLEKQR